MRLPEKEWLQPRGDCGVRRLARAIHTVAMGIALTHSSRAEGEPVLLLTTPWMLSMHVTTSLAVWTQQALDDAVVPFAPSRRRLITGIAL